MVSDATVLGMAHAATGARLAAYSRVHTTDVDDAAELIGRIFCPHALDPLRHSWPDFHALHNCATFDGFSVNYVAYGGSVSIDPGCLDRFFLLQMPIRGRAQVRTGGRDIESRPGAVASLLSPTLPTRMIWQDNCAQLILLVDRRQVESRAAALAERPAGPIEFEPHIDLDTPFGRALQFQIEYLVDLAEHGGPAPDLSPVMMATLRESTSDFFSPASATISAMRSIGRRSTAKHCPPCSSGHGTPRGPRRRAARSGKTVADVRHRNPVIATGLQAPFRGLYFGSAAGYPPRASERTALECPFG